MRPGQLAAIVVVALTSSVSVQPRTAPVFTSYDPIDLTVEAPYPELFDRSRANPEYAVEGRLSYTEPTSGVRVTMEKVRVEMRGHTSRRVNECDFPKLKLVFDNPPPAGTVFAGMKSIKIGTHCADRPDG